MTMTIMAAAKEVAALEDPTMEVLAKRFLPDLFAEHAVTQVLSSLSCSVDLQKESKSMRRLMLRFWQLLFRKQWRLHTKQL